MSVRVVRIITRLNIGGPSIQAVTLSDRLRSHGFETQLVHGRLGDGEGDMSLPARRHGVDRPICRQLQRPLAPLADVQALAQLYRHHARVRPAIVHTHMAKAGTLGGRAAALYNRTARPRRPAQLVHTYHGHVLEGYFAARRPMYSSRIERALARSRVESSPSRPRSGQSCSRSYRIGRREQYASCRLASISTPFRASTTARTCGGARRTRSCRPTRRGDAPSDG